MEPDKFKVSTIKLDEATRARIAKELGVPTGLKWVPEEITFMAVDAKEAGESEVQGHAYGLADSVYYSPSITPNLSVGRIAGTGLIDARRLIIARKV